MQSLFGIRPTLTHYIALQALCLEVLSCSRCINQTDLPLSVTSLPKIIWKEGRVAALSHTYAVKTPLVTMARPNSSPTVPLSVNRSPNPTTYLIPGPVRPMMPNGIRIRSAVFPQYTGQSDALTGRSSTGKFATRATRPKNAMVSQI